MAIAAPSSPAWTAALKLLDLHERSETCLGYGGAGTSAGPDRLKARILDTTKQIVSLGVTNPEIIGLMGIFEDKVGPDTISDLTTNSILRALEEITGDFRKVHSIRTRKFIIGVEEFELPENSLKPGTGFALVPKDERTSGGWRLTSKGRRSARIHGGLRRAQKRAKYLWSRISRLRFSP
ncbi:hypothetical protein ACVWZ3_003868 [Bradyrhizobium sp. i1.3.6]